MSRSLKSLVLVLASAGVVIFPAVDFTLARQVTSLAAVSALLYGFVWESDR